MSNIPGSIRPSPDDQSYSLSWLFRPDTSIPMLDVPSDFGKFVVGCLLHPERTMGTHVLAASGWFTPIDVCKAVETKTGKKTVYNEVPLAEFKGSKELLDNMLMIKDYGYYGPGGAEGVNKAHSLAEGEKFSTFEGFLSRISLNVN
jgi:hypothetical protein